jgi:hypothetical protein
MTDPNTRARRSASEEEQRITAIVKREIRETFKNGLPSGTYSSYMWDGMKIVGGGAGGIVIDAICTIGALSTQTVLGDTTPYRVDFTHKVHDPLNQVTTGASWAFTAAAAGTYFVLAEVVLNIAVVDWITDDRADMTLQGDVSDDLATWVGIGIIAEPSPLPLIGFRGFALDAGDEIYIRIQQDCGTDRTITTALSSIVIAHV